MTATVRELVHARVKAVLDGIGGGVKAFRNRTSIPNINEMPLLILYDGDENITESEEFGIDRLVLLNFDLEAWVKGSSDDDLGPNLNALMGAAVAALQTDAQLNNGGSSVAMDTRYDGMERPVADKTEGSKPFMGAVLRFQVKYQTSANDPTSQG